MWVSQLHSFSINAAAVKQKEILLSEDISSNQHAKLELTVTQKQKDTPFEKR